MPSSLRIPLNAPDGPGVNFETELLAKQRERRRRERLVYDSTLKASIKMLSLSARQIHFSFAAGKRLEVLTRRKVEEQTFSACFPINPAQKGEQGEEVQVET